jgi:glycosyltransferase involved in cell wall biosynthesis
MSTELAGSDRVKLLYLDHAPILGGAQVVLLNLIRALDDNRFAPQVATAADSPLIPELQAAGIVAMTVPFGRLNQAGIATPVNLLHAARAVTHLIQQHQIALLHTNTVRAHIVGSLAAAFTRTPLVWTLHDNTFPRVLVRVLAPVPAQAITVSTWLRDLYGPLGLAHKTVVIPNGLSMTTPLETDAGLRQELRIPMDAPLVINVGRLVAGKAPHLFVEAARLVSWSVSNAYFVLVGGPDRLEPGQRPSAYADVLEQAVRESGLGERLILTGYRPDVARFYAAADLVAYCPVLPEGLPTVLLEAMRYAKPVVATATGGAKEIVRDGQTGRLVPPGNADALAAAILELLRDAGRARALGEAGRVRLNQEFDLQTQVAKIEQVYQAVLCQYP